MRSGCVEPRRWTRDEYHRMADAGIFGVEERVELVDGELFVQGRPSPPEAAVIAELFRLLDRAFRASAHVRPRCAVALDAASEPEPDLAVVEGEPRDYLEEHPSTALVLIEVARVSLAHDRGLKAAVYARAGITDYWIVNLTDSVVEIHRDPAPEPHSRTGWAYRSIVTLTRADRVRPLAAPQVELAVADLLP